MKPYFVTTLNNLFVKGALITINSLIRCCKTTPTIIILYWEEILEENKELIAKICPNIIYRKISAQDYPETKFDSEYRVWKYNCHFRYDIFDLNLDSDRVIYFDCDIIFNTVVEELLSFDVDFGAVSRPAGTIVQLNNRVGFDAGLITIGKKFLNKKIKFDLINLSMEQAPLDKFISSRIWVGNEPVLNTYFNEFYSLPEKFNICLDRITNNLIPEPKNIQFIGHKKRWDGNNVESQFDKYIIDKIIENNGKYYSEIVLKKILKIYNREKEDVQDKLGKVIY